MKKNLIMALAFLLLACNSKDLIVEKNTKKLILVELTKHYSNNLFIVKDKDSISMIIKKINKANRDPAIFIADYKIVIYYRDNSTRTILCNSKRINIDVITYNLNESLRTIIVHSLP